MQDDSAASEGSAPPPPGRPRASASKRFRRAALDAVFAVLAYPAGLLLRRARRAWRYMPRTRRMLKAAGVFPVRHHFYEPVVYAEDLRKPLTEERVIAGLDMNRDGQLRLLSQLSYGQETRDLPVRGDARADKQTFFYRNGSFEDHDAAFLYAMVRHFKPKRIFEIGSGYSTLVTRLALAANQAGDPAQACRHLCIEPFGKAWLDDTGAEILKQRVEFSDPALFEQLEGGDILFIDSTHMVRPQGDVLFEVQEVLGRLKPGVVVHIHDIFTPRDYPPEWVLDDQKLWNEQYLVEAFLAFNDRFEIIGALNFLGHNHPAELAAATGLDRATPRPEPRSLWLRRAA